MLKQGHVWQYNDICIPLNSLISMAKLYVITGYQGRTPRHYLLLGFKFTQLWYRGLLSAWITTLSVAVIFNTLKDEGTKRRINSYHLSALCLKMNLLRTELTKEKSFISSFKVPFEYHTTSSIKTVNLIKSSSVRWHCC